MSETTITQLSDEEEVFAEVISEIVTRKHQEYEREHRELGASRVPLSDISIQPKDFENYSHIMRGIRPLRKTDSTAEEMLGALFWKGELVACSRNMYRLSKAGVLYRDLTEDLAITK